MLRPPEWMIASNACSATASSHLVGMWCGGFRYCCLLRRLAQPDLRTKILKMNKISMFGRGLRDNVGLSEDIEMLYMQLERCAMQ